jgi:hypothetical protein
MIDDHCGMPAAQPNPDPIQASKAGWWSADAKIHLQLCCCAAKTNNNYLIIRASASCHVTRRQCH